MTPERKAESFDPVNKPKGYNSHPSGVETVEVIRHLSVMLACAVKYVWRYELKGTPVQELEKGIWCFRDEVKRLREFDRAVLWIGPGEYWRDLAHLVVIHDGGQLLGEVLRILLQAPSFGFGAADACHQMAKLCEARVKELRAEGREAVIPK